eukprot:gene12472-15679_t
MSTAENPPTVRSTRREFVLPDGVNNLRGYVKAKAGVNNLRGYVKAKAGLNNLRGYVKAKAGVNNLRGYVKAKAGLNNLRGYVKEPLADPRKPSKEEGQILVLNNDASFARRLIFNFFYLEIVASPAACRYLKRGLAGCPGFKQRFEKELRPLVNDTYDLGVLEPPVRQYQAEAMTRAQYNETGGSASRRELR